MKKVSVFFLLVFFWTAQIWSQDTIHPLKVGVVLSGGGAKGYAHVGALRAIEESGVHIDYIAGTSMGAIVGGLYAAGYSVSELDSILHHLDISNLIQDKVPRSVKPFFDKEYGEKYALSLNFKDYRVSLPSALSNGQNLFNLLNQLTYRVHHIREFSQLPVPFFCIGTDVSTGEEVVFDSGSLPSAMRASGAFPGLLAPFRVGERLITDGGIVNNFPARELKEKGVDFVIGINVETGLYNEEELYSLDKILEQIGSFQMVQHSLGQLQYCDLLIKPNVQGFGVTSFEAIDTLVKNGYLAAQAVKDSLKSIAQKQHGAGRAKIPFQQLPSLLFDKVQITNNQVFSEDVVKGYFPRKLTDTLSPAQFFEGITNLYGTGSFQYIDYQFFKDDEGCKVLALHPIPKPGYDRLLRLGIHFDDVYKSSVLLNLTYLNVGFRNSTASMNLILGDKFRYTFNYLIDASKGPDIGFNSSLFFNNIPSDLFKDVVLDSSLVLGNLNFNISDFSNEIYARFITNNWRTLGISGQIKYFQSSSDQVLTLGSDEPFIGERGLYLTGSLFYKLDTRDYPNFASRGAHTSIYARAMYPLQTRVARVGSFRLGYNLDISTEGILPVSERFSLGLSGELGLTFGRSIPPYFYFLGGNNQNFINNFKPFPGIPFASKVGSNMIKAKVYGQYRLFRNQFIILSAQHGNIAEGIDFEGVVNKGIRSISLGYGIRTPLGPIQLTYAVSNLDEEIYFNLGYWF